MIRDREREYSSKTLQVYNDAMEKSYGQRQSGPDMMERLSMCVKKLFASQLMKTQWFTRNVVTDKWFFAGTSDADASD